MSKLLLISVKEKYVNEILSGRKSIELRKVIPKANIGDIVIIYTTKPTMAVSAIANIKNILIYSPETMWALKNKHLGISKTEYDKYFHETNKAIGIELINIFKLEKQIPLNVIKDLNPKFTPPQTFQYLDKFSTLRGYKEITKII